MFNKDFLKGMAFMGGLAAAAASAYFAAKKYIEIKSDVVYESESECSEECCDSDSKKNECKEPAPEAPSCSETVSE